MPGRSTNQGGLNQRLKSCQDDTTKLCIALPFFRLFQFFRPTEPSGINPQIQGGQQIIFGSTLKRNLLASLNLLEITPFSFLYFARQGCSFRLLSGAVSCGRWQISRHPHGENEPTLIRSARPPQPHSLMKTLTRHHAPAILATLLLTAAPALRAADGSVSFRRFAPPPPEAPEPLAPTPPPHSCCACAGIDPCNATHYRLVMSA